MRLRRVYSRIGCYLVCAIGFTALSAPGQSHYYYFKEKRSLELTTSEVAIVQPVVAGKSVAQPKLDSFGIADTAVRAGAIRGTARADVPASKQTEARIRTLVGEMAADDKISFASPVFKGEDGGAIVVTRDVLIGFSPGTDESRAQQLIAEMTGGEILEQDYGNMPGVYKVRTAEKNGFEVLSQANALAVLPEVLFAEPNMRFTGSESRIPNDPGFPDCWGLDNTGQSGGVVDQDMDVPEAWDLTIGFSSVIIGVFESGVQQDHPDIQQIPGVDLTDDPSTTGGPVNSFENHGTAVAGSIAATIDNNLGTVGVAPGCRVFSMRTFIGLPGGTWDSETAWTVDALTEAENVGARVTNNSNSYGSFQSAAIAAKYASTRAGGMVHFASAGNNGVPGLGYPSRLSSVNAVAAIDRDGELASFSSFGNGLAFSAPGVDIYTTDRTGPAGYESGDYTFISGTSFSSPYAAGVAALLISQNPALSAEEVETLMQLSCVDIGTAGYDTTYGWGLLNAYDTLVNEASGALGGELQFAEAAYTVSEHGTTATVLVSRVGGSYGDAAVEYTFADGTATAERDYIATPGTLQWQNGENDTKPILIPILRDQLDEPDETFTVTLGNITGATNGTPTLTTVTISNVFRIPDFYYVSPAGLHQAPYTNWTDAATNIQDAVDVAIDGDVVLVTNGVYDTGKFMYHGWSRIAVSNEVTVRSVNGPEFTTLVGVGPVGSDAIRCATLGDWSRLEGFTLTNGHTQTSGGVDWQSGGGAWCEPTAVVSNCIVVGNSGNAQGGGTYGGIVQNSTIAGNRSGKGGGAASGTIQTCSIFENLAQSGGGTADSTVRNSLIHGNTAVFGGGTYQGSNQSCTISGNTGFWGAGTAFATNLNCIVYYNLSSEFYANWYRSTMTYSCTIPGLAGAGNITDDPQFVGASIADFHLSASSPCINAGINQSWMAVATDLDGAERIQSAIVDMGCYESMPPFPDTDGDGMDDNWELQHFLNLTNANFNSDTDHDGFRDGFEFYAGTNPTNDASYLAITSTTIDSSGNEAVIRWSSESNRVYALHGMSNLIQGVDLPLYDGIAATPPENTFTDTVNGVEQRTYGVEVEIRPPMVP